MRFLQDRRQQVRFNVSAAHDGNSLCRLGKLSTMIEPGCERNGPARFRHDMRRSDHPARSAPNLRLGHRDDVVDVLAYVLEIDRTNTLGPKSVGERTGSALG